MTLAEKRMRGFKRWRTRSGMSKLIREQELILQIIFESPSESGIFTILQDLGRFLQQYDEPLIAYENLKPAKVAIQ